MTVKPSDVFEVPTSRVQYWKCWVCPTPQTVPDGRFAISGVNETAWAVPEYITSLLKRTILPLKHRLPLLPPKLGMKPVAGAKRK